MEFECRLTTSENYIETLNIKQIACQPGLTELVIKTQLLTAKNPDERRKKASCFVDRAQLIELATMIERYLTATESVESIPELSNLSRDPI